MSREVLFDSFVKLIEDNFREREKGVIKNHVKHGIHPHEYKLLKVQTVRGAGISAAATRLMSVYEPSLLITNGHSQARDFEYRSKEPHIDNPYFPVHGVMSYSQVTHTWNLGRRPNQKYRLIIIDPAESVFSKLNWSIEKLDYLREMLYPHCDLLVELG